MCKTNRMNRSIKFLQKCFWFGPRRIPVESSNRKLVEFDARSGLKRGWNTRPGGWERPARPSIYRVAGRSRRLAAAMNHGIAVVKFSREIIERKNGPPMPGEWRIRKYGERMKDKKGAKWSERGGVGGRPAVEKPPADGFIWSISSGTGHGCCNDSNWTANWSRFPSFIRSRFDAKEKGKASVRQSHETCSRKRRFTNSVCFHRHPPHHHPLPVAPRWLPREQTWIIFVRSVDVSWTLLEII